jgi:hypothetical protein
MQTPAIFNNNQYFLYHHKFQKYFLLIFNLFKMLNCPKIILLPIDCTKFIKVYLFILLEVMEAISMVEAIIKIFKIKFLIYHYMLI